ncbi:MAG: hypothetical protein JXB30_00185 [Anaerolineae bacterium]|nr:hypothetical protein [Anaerolineae bacterium]
MKYKYLVVLIVVVLAAMGSMGTALADAAPPEPPPGSSVGTGDPSTYVQMVSESVLMEITDYDGPPLWNENMRVASNMMVGHVQASFNMVNQGTDTETMAVRFPLGSPDGFLDVKTVGNFVATVDGQIAETQTIEQAGEWDTMVPWATWQATFAPGQNVILGVEYDVHPVGYVPWGTFTYILETGAGWYGPIGEGMITFRLPYEANDLNTVRGNAWEPGNSLGGYTISGTDIIWHFTNLEPTNSDNVHFTVLPPTVWLRIEQAQASVDANPNSADAQLELARALHSTLSFKYGLVEIGSSATLAEQAKAAYKRAFELAPDNLDVCTEYLDLMLTLWWPGTPSTKSEELPVVMERAKALAPDDAQVLELQQRYQYAQQDEGYFQQLPGTPTVMAVSSPTPASVSTPVPTSIPGVVLTSTSIPVPVVMAAAASPSTGSKVGVWVVLGTIMLGCGTVMIGVMLASMWIYRKRAEHR